MKSFNVMLLADKEFFDELSDDTLMFIQSYITDQLCYRMSDTEHEKIYKEVYASLN